MRQSCAAVNLVQPAAVTLILKKTVLPVSLLQMTELDLRIARCSSVISRFTLLVKFSIRVC